MRSTRKSAWKLLENYCLLIKEEDERRNITSNIFWLSFQIWMWIVSREVAALLWLWDNKCTDKKFACWSCQEGWLQSWVLGTRLESVLKNSNLFMQKRVQWKSKISCSVMVAVELNVLLDQFKVLLEVCFPKSSPKPYFLLLPFWRLYNNLIII